MEHNQQLYGGVPYCTRVLMITPEALSTLSPCPGATSLFLSAESRGRIIMDNSNSRAPGCSLLFAFLATGVCAAAVFFTSQATMICVVVTVILLPEVNVINRPLLNHFGRAGVPLAMTNIATGDYLSHQESANNRIFCRADYQPFWLTGNEG